MSYVEYIKGKPPSIDECLAKAFGLEAIPRPSYFRRIQNGQEYSWIAGALAWPGGREPGVGVIVGVERFVGIETMPRLHLLEEFTHPYLTNLVWMAADKRKKWGVEDCPEVLRLWYGDYTRFLSLLAYLSVKIRKRDGAHNGLYIAPVADYDKTNFFELIIQTLFDALQPGPDGKKQLYLDDNPMIKNAIKSLPLDAAVKGSPEEYSAVAALGYAVHSLLSFRPWMQQIRGGILPRRSGKDLFGEKEYSWT